MTFSPALAAFESTGRYVAVGRHRLFVVERGEGPTLLLMDVCARFPGFYGPGLRSIMKRPEAFSAEDEAILTELLVHDDGHLRLPALSGYMRERYVHRDRWIGALTRSFAIVSFVWAQDDPIANLDLGRELHALVPAAPFVELDGVGHFLIFEDPDRVAAAVLRVVGCA
ncbi:MAG TPA: alpha/beta hydrolase [Polyangiaceae bacterium]|jgi:pimeloyl-ACP methyl ester carboxylesterase|nr:alpha/beta hydrolase [Polyangiaceae bacterium]